MLDFLYTCSRISPIIPNNSRTWCCPRVNIPLYFWRFFLHASWSLLSGSPSVWVCQSGSSSLQKLFTMGTEASPLGMLLVQQGVLQGGRLPQHKRTRSLTLGLSCASQNLGNLVNDSMCNNQCGIKFLKKCVHCIKYGHVNLFCNHVHLDHHLCS